LKLIFGGGGAVWWLFDVAWLLLGKMQDAEGKTIRRPF
jgi:hypothetical protein